jgi:hypothetical protein
MRKSLMLIIAGFIIVGFCGCVTAVEPEKGLKPVEVVSISVKKEPTAEVSAPAVAPALKPIKVQPPAVVQKVAVNPVVPAKTCKFGDFNNKILEGLIFLLVFLFFWFGWRIRAERAEALQKKIKAKHHIKKKK